MTARGELLAKPIGESRRSAPLHVVRLRGRGEARDRRARLALLAADVLAVVVAAFAAGVPRWSAAAPALALLAKLHGLYDRDELVLRKTTLDQAPQLIQVVAIALFGLWVADPAAATRGPLLAFAATVLVAAVVLRAAARRGAAALLAPERCVFVGGAPERARLAARLAAPKVHADLVAQFTPPAEGGPQEVAALLGLVAEAGADRVVIDPHALPSGDMLDLVRGAKAAGLRVTLLPRVLDVVGSAVVFDDLEGLTLLGVRRFGLSRSSRLLKRAFDLAVALGVLAAIAPLMAIIAVAIAVESGGPVLFRQLRVGRDGRAFLIIKFRTMVAGADARRAELRLDHGLQDDLFKLADDPRVTRVGRVLRAASLDELPQLLNVVRGEMSIVGPRPLVVDEDAQITGWDRRRLQLTPGMTGPWQIASVGRVPLGEMVKMDYLYAAGWSLWLDVRIVLRTVPHVLLRRGM